MPLLQYVRAAFRYGLFVLRYGLAAIGAYLLFMLWWERFGLATTLWLLVAPALYGLYLGLRPGPKP